MTGKKEELGWAEKYDLDRALQSTVDWYLDQRDWLEAANNKIFNTYREVINLGSYKLGVTLMNLFVNTLIKVCFFFLLLFLIACSPPPEPKASYQQVSSGDGKTLWINRYGEKVEAIGEKDDKNKRSSQKSNDEDKIARAISPENNASPSRPACELFPGAVLPPLEGPREFVPCETDSKVFLPHVTWHSPTQYIIRALVKGGWPVYIEVDHNLDQIAKLEISIEKNSVPPEEREFQNSIKFEIPERFGSEPKVGEYKITALDRSGNEEKFQLIGIGAGPNAVGSLKIDQIGFGDSIVDTSKKEKAWYRFRSLSDFDARVDFIRMENTENKFLLVQTSGRVIIHKGEWVGLEKDVYWDCTDSNGKFSIGKHQLRVRASHEKGDWLNEHSKEIEIIDHHSD